MALNSCRWTATNPQKLGGVPNGWFDAIEVAVFERDKAAWARGEAKGDPVQGVGPGAFYDSSYGQVWFACGHDRFCVVKARLASANKREDIALQLAKQIAERLR
jgi:hypothetical protein